MEPTAHPPPDRLESIAAMAQAIASADTMQEIFRALFLFAAQTTAADAIFVALYTPTTGLRRCVYSASLVLGDAGTHELEEDDDPSVFPDIPLNTGPQSRAILTSEIVNTPDLDAVIEGLPRVNAGSDFHEKPPRSSIAVPFTADGHALGAFEVQSTRRAAFSEQDVPYLRMAANLAAIAVQDLDLRERERAQHEATLRALGLALEYRDYETKGHTDQVVNLSLAFARTLGLGLDQRQALRWGAYLHDLGKVAISDTILLKPGRLTQDEFTIIQRHTLIGWEMARDIPFLPPETREVVRSHHERWDGSGYPDGLQGDTIPFLARVFSLVDVYDALTSKRPYKGAWTHEAAAAEIRAQAGRQFDPNLVPAFLEVTQDFRKAAASAHPGKPSKTP